MQAIEDRDFERFLEILDDGACAAVCQASEESHALDLNVVDGRASQDTAVHCSNVRKTPRL